MRKSTRVLISFLVLITMISTIPFTVLAESSSNYIKVIKNESYTKDGKFHLSFTFKNVSKGSTIKIKAMLLNPSGGVVCNYNGFEFGSGKTQAWGFGYNYSSLPSGTYTLKIHASDWNYAYGEVRGWDWSYNIKHTAPAPSFSYKSYETFYNKSGILVHKINIQCKYMKGKKLYCKLYDSDGNLVYDWGTDTPARKTNNETGFFTWGGYQDGYKYPSGDYLFVVTSSANKKVVQKTLKLNILEVGNK